MLGHFQAVKIHMASTGLVYVLVPRLIKSKLWSHRLAVAWLIQSLHKAARLSNLRRWLRTASCFKTIVFPGTFQYSIAYFFTRFHKKHNNCSIRSKAVKLDKLLGSIIVHVGWRCGRHIPIHIYQYISYDRRCVNISCTSPSLQRYNQLSKQMCRITV